MRYFCSVSYFGKNYDGWQSQSNHNGIEDKIEDILSSLLDRKINIIGAGRTDKGVHAYGQTFHFDIDKKIDDESHFLYALNRLLPLDIKINFIKEVDNNFHARFSSVAKNYIYKIYIGKNIPFYFESHAIYHYKINLDLLKESSKYFIGEHNYMNLTSKEIDDKNFIRNIYEINIINKNEEILISFLGNGFMKYMIRYIVGEMIEVACKRKNINELSNLFIGPRKISNHKAPAEGLYLNKVIYS